MTCGYPLALRRSAAARRGLPSARCPLRAGGGAIPRRACAPSGCLGAIPGGLPGSLGLCASLQASPLAARHLVLDPRLRALDLPPSAELRPVPVPRGAPLQFTAMGPLPARALSSLGSCIRWPHRDRALRLPLARLG